MLDPSALEALALRVESGSGKDRELDTDLCILFRAHPYGPDHWLKDAAFPFRSERKGWVHPMGRDGVTSLGGEWESPRYTTSLDAVKALIEAKLPGWAYAAISEKLRGCIGYVHNNEPSFVGLAAHLNPAKIWIECRAASPERALLAASLRALAQKEEG